MIFVLVSLLDLLHRVVCFLLKNLLVSDKCMNGERYFWYSVPFVVLCQAWTFGPLILLVRKSIGGHYVRYQHPFGLASAILHSDHIIQIDTYCTSITFLCLINLQLHTHYKLTKLTLLLLGELCVMWNPYFEFISLL